MKFVGQGLHKFTSMLRWHGLATIACYDYEAQST